MHNTNDDILINYRPDSLQEDNYIADIEAIIENGAYHSDEVSETDDEKTQDEVSRHIRPKNKNESDHYVIRVYDKPCQRNGLFHLHIIVIVVLEKVVVEAEVVIKMNEKVVAEAEVVVKSNEKVVVE